MLTAQECVFYRCVLTILSCCLPLDDGNVWTGEFTSKLSIIEDLIGRHSDFYVILGGDHNVDASRDKLHTTLPDKCCQENDIVPLLKHTSCYTYKFNMSRFHAIDHVIVDRKSTRLNSSHRL